MTAKAHLVRAFVSFFFVVGFANAGDGAADGKKSIGGSGEMIQFAMPDGSSKLSGIEIHGSRYGASEPPAEKFLVYILNEEMTKVVAVEMAPYSLFERGAEKWVAVEFSAPIELPKNGWVVVDFRAGRTKGVYVSYDNSEEKKRSKVGLPGMEARDVDFEGGWMIRPIVSK